MSWDGRNFIIRFLIFVFIFSANCDNFAEFDLDLHCILFISFLNLYFLLLLYLLFFLCDSVLDIFSARCDLPKFKWIILSN